MGLDNRMKGDNVPDKDHISRYCKSSFVEDGQIQATAFMLRNDEEYLSVNWLEFLKCTNRGHEITEIRNIYSAKLKVGAHAKIAVLNVGEVREKVKTESLDMRNLDIKHEPIDVPPIIDHSHSAIYNLKQDDELIAELMLEVVDEDYSART